MSLADLDNQINALILAGNNMEAFEKFYADDLVMQENNDEPVAGKDANRKREQDFAANIEDFHGAQLHSSVVGDNVSMSEWTFEFTLKGMGRVAFNEVIRRIWRDGLVVNERYYYNLG